jgi:16S rRNA (uracil1498-N3)-methyltransferase
VDAEGFVAGACEQSGRAVLPALSEPRALADFAAALDVQVDAGTRRFLLDPREGASLASLGLAPDAGLVLVIGPEGGLSERDLAALRAARFTGLRMGPRVLRTETAGLAALAALNALYGDWR